MKPQISQDITWPQILALFAFIAAFAISDNPLAPPWLAHSSSVGFGFFWIYLLFRDARTKAAAADELELRIQFEGHALALRLTIAALILAFQFEHAMDFHLTTFHFVLILVASIGIGPWWIRRRYR